MRIHGVWVLAVMALTWSNLSSGKECAMELQLLVVVGKIDEMLRWLCCI